LSPGATGAGLTAVNGANVTANSVTGAGINEHTLSLANQTARLSIYNITVSLDRMIPPIPKAFTITKLTTFVVGGENVTFRLEDCTATGATCNRPLNSTDWASTVGEIERTAFENSTIGAGNWTKLNITGVNGSVTDFAIGWDYNEN
ncbi:MAG: hypothetical protein IMZ53_17045, partial [Thermoplasmata archaeon]|nr:hypothetical protein [Thermoplasmata archaeon]